MKPLALLTLLALTSFAETKNCGCAEKSPSRAAEIIGEKKLTFTVIGMSCAGCEKGLTEKLKKVTGVISVDQADHQKKLVTITVKPDTCETTIKAAITKAGYLIKEK